MHPDDDRLITAQRAELRDGTKWCPPPCGAEIVDPGQDMGSVGSINGKSVKQFLGRCPHGHDVKWNGQ
jgi:hypothetical protein